MTNLQDKPIVVDSPVEIEYACNEIRKQIASLTWVSHPYFIAQRFKKEDATTKKRFVYPETYAPETPGSRNYHRLTPDNDYSGMCFFMVGKGENDFEPNQYNYLKHRVSIIFSVNLELIDKSRLDNGLFTQDLIRQVRRLLTNAHVYFDFNYKIVSETRDLDEIYREFSLGDLEQYNRAPLQCFRFELDVTIEENCGADPTGIPPTGGFPPTVSQGVITVLNSTENLPLTVQPNTSFLILNVTELNSDLEISNYKPNGLLKGATVRIRKMDASTNKITYSKNGLEYSFVNMTTEYIDLLWNGNELII